MRRCRRLPRPCRAPAIQARTHKLPHTHARARSLSEREAALYQPTPKRQAVATSTPGGGLKGAAPPLARTPLTARTPHLPAGKLGGGGASALRLAGPAAGPGAMDVDGLPSGAGRLAGGAGALQPRQGTPSEAAAKFASRTGVSPRGGGRPPHTADLPQCAPGVPPCQPAHGACAAVCICGRGVQKGEVVLSLHDHLPEWSGASSRGGAPAVQLAGEALPPAGQHLFMTETLEGKVRPWVVVEGPGGGQVSTPPRVPAWDAAPWVEPRQQLRFATALP